MTRIGSWAFFGTTNLTEIIFEEGSQLELIGMSAFSGTGLTSIDLPDTVTGIWSRAFANATNLTSITIPYSVTVMDERVFYGWTSAQSIRIVGRVVAFSGWSVWWRHDSNSGVAWNV